MIKRCIQLAYNGLGTTYPNPMVGCVIVHDGKIIGEGWHQKAGEPHAEVRAIASVKDQSLLAESTLYVSLEPCSHYGKTPPCADLIIAHRIPRVVIGTIDPFAKVAGRGIEKLRAAGCEVTVGVMEKECRELNKRFFTFHEKKRPYIFLKWAESADGFIAPAHKDTLAPVWISSFYAQQYVHSLRAREQAILVGGRTALADTPSLTTRHWYGANPLRVLIDPHQRVPQTAPIYDTQAPTLCLADTHPQAICDILYACGIQSLIVEGGRYMLQRFIDENLWDEALVFTGDMLFEEGVKAPVITSYGSLSTPAIQGLKERIRRLGNRG